MRYQHPSQIELEVCRPIKAFTLLFRQLPIDHYQLIEGLVVTIVNDKRLNISMCRYILQLTANIFLRRTICT